MDEWIKSPVIIPAVIAFVTLLVTVGIWIGRVNSDRENFKEFMKEVRDDIGKIRDDIGEIFRKLPSSPVDSLSPLQLNDLGDQIADHMDAKAWATALSEKILKQIEGMEDYEIDEYSKDYVSRLDEAWQRKISSSAYKFGLERNSIELVLAVVLRNVLLQRLQTQSGD